jgi:hypothetical protein
MSAWASLMLIAGGLFAGGAATFAWSRVPIWRRMPVQEFIGDFEETLRRTDKVQPALLVAAIGAAAGYAACGGEGDRRDARPLVSREPRTLDARGGVVRRRRRSSAPVITR